MEPQASPALQITGGRSGVARGHGPCRTLTEKEWRYPAALLGFDPELDPLPKAACARRSWPDAACRSAISIASCRSSQFRN